MRIDKVYYLPTISTHIIGLALDPNNVMGGKISTSILILNEPQMFKFIEIKEGQKATSTVGDVSRLGVLAVAVYDSQWYLGGDLMNVATN